MYSNYVDYFELLYSGCCKPKLWDETGVNCPSCELFDYCEEGQYMVQKQAISSN